MLKKNWNSRFFFDGSPSYGYAFTTLGRGQNDCFVGDPPLVFRVLDVLSRTQDGLLYLENIEVTNKYKPEPDF